VHTKIGARIGVRVPTSGQAWFGFELFFALGEKQKAQDDGGFGVHYAREFILLLLF
jgi:hypothetical protein